MLGTIGIVRKILPTRVKRILGTALYKSMCRFPLLTVIVAPILYGISVKLQPGKTFLIQHQGTKIVYPRSASQVEDLSLFVEIFRDQPYEQFFGVPQGGIVVDIGAHIGIFTIKAAKAAGEKGLVVAIEPEPSNIALLLNNIAVNEITNVIVVAKAASSYKGKPKLYLSHSSGGHSLVNSLDNYIEVETDSLDNIMSELGLPRVDFVKIDAEGSELEVLKGAEKLLASHDVKLSIAAYHRLEDGMPEFPQIRIFLEQRGFNISTKNSSFIYGSRTRVTIAPELAI